MSTSIAIQSTQLKTSRFRVNLSGAEYDITKRLHLHRPLKGNGRRVIVLMCKPSKAGAIKNDSTVTKLMNRLNESFNYSSLSLLNVANNNEFKWIDNLRYLLEDSESDILIAWGAKIRDTKYISRHLRETINNMCVIQNILEFDQGAGELMPTTISMNTPLRNATRFR